MGYGDLGSKRRASANARRARARTRKAALTWIGLKLSSVLERPSTGGVDAGNRWLAALASTVVMASGTRSWSEGL
jgi:hypothetical protein